MYKSYLLKRNFWSKKGCDDSKKVYMKHDPEIGGIYAIIHHSPPRGVEIMVNGENLFFNNFDKLDAYLHRLEHREDNFLKIMKRKDISQKLRTLKL